MKKSLIIVAIVICLICIAVAGTVAIYNKNFDVNESGTTVTAKKFFIGEGSASTFADVSIAPDDETVEWAFDIVNFKDDNFITEVDMNLKINVELKGDITNLVVKLVEVIDGVDVVTSISLIGSGSQNFTDADGTISFAAKVATTRSFKILVSWPSIEDGDAADTANGENASTSSIKVTVTGTQKV